MRTAGSATIDLLANSGENGIAEADLVVWYVKDYTGDPEIFPFWSGHDTQSATVVSPFTGNPVTYDFVGAGALLSIGETLRTSDLSIRRKSISMSPIHPTVKDMWTAYDMRLAQVAVFQAVIDPATMITTEALLEFVGELNGAPKEVAAVGGESAIRFDCVSDSRQLTRFNSAKRSPEHQESRGNDKFHKYIGVAGDWKIPFGRK